MALLVLVGAAGCLSYLALEVLFYCFFKYYLLPAANKRVDVHPYRDYKIGERHRIILRCLERLVRNAKGRQSVEECIKQYLLSWFHEQRAEVDLSCFLLQDQAKKKRLLISRHSSGNLSAATTTTTTDDESFSASCDTTESCCPEDQVSSFASNTAVATVKQPWTVEELGKEDMDRLFAWAAFGKDVEHLTQQELEDLEQTFVGCQERFGLYFREGSTHKYTAKRLNLEDITADHRPLILYLVVGLVRLLAGLWLIFSGFRPCYSRSGMRGWFRPARNETKQLPLLFFHGIAPGGLAFYLPMVLKGLAADDRAVFLFENPAISSDLFSGLKPLTQQATLDGVREILNRFMPQATDVAVVGHSFGTVPLTWLLHCPNMRHHIRQAVLLDPVTILLTTPDVMNSFLYSTKKSKVKLVATELLVQNYIRRHFPYYNSDLWFEDLPTEDCQVLVCLSENDDVIDAAKVRHESEQHCRRQDSGGVIHWEKSQHGDCVVSAPKWNQIKTWMVQQEEARVQEPSRTR